MVQPKVAVVVTHPIQHFCPLYRELARTGEVGLRVFFASFAGYQPYYDRDFGQIVQFQGDLTDGFAYEFLPDATPDLGATGLIGNEHVGERLSSYNPDVVHIYGYRQPISRSAINWARRFGRGLLYCSDSELLAPEPLWARATKRILLPLIFSRCHGFLTVGDCNEDYYRHYGVPPSRFFRCPFTIDEERLARAIADRGARRELLLERLGIPKDSLVLLTVGKLTPRKAANHVIEALSRLQNTPLKRRPCLVLAGNGPEADRFRALADQLARGAVRFPGFVEVADLPDYYASADLLVHPSSKDPHPLAISEGITAGLPVIVSDRVGSVGVTDDVRIDINGFSYRYGDIDRLSSLIAMLCNDPERLQRMSSASLEIAKLRTMRTSTEAYISAAREVARITAARRRDPRPPVDTEVFAGSSTNPGGPPR